MTELMYTGRYMENLQFGIMVCGINMGKPKKAQPPSKQTYVPRGETFFSDNQCRDFRFRRSILNWFEWWGHPLQGSSALATAYERAIFHTNWLPDSDSSRRISHVKQTCINAPRQFFHTVSAFEPRIIILTSVALHDALQSTDLSARREQCIGKEIGETKTYRPAKEGSHENGTGRLRAKLSNFECGSTVIAMPHPQARGMSEIYVKEAGLALEVPQVIRRFRDQIHVP